MADLDEIPQAGQPNPHPLAEPIGPEREPAEAELWRLAELDEFRAEASRALDWAVEYLSNSERYPVLPHIEPGEVARLLPEVPPSEGVGMKATVEEVNRVVMPGVTHWNAPGFMAYFATTSSPPGILGELYTAVLNQNALVWQSSPAITEVEPVVLGWLRQMMGLPPDWFGITYDTASTSTLCAVAAAREAAVPGIGETGLDRDLGLRMYASEEAHSVVDKAAMVLGIGRENVRKIAVDAEYRMIPEALGRAIQADLDRGLKPFCVVATVGTTSTTSVDPVRPIAEICRRFNVWLHVDAAYGGAAAILPEMRWIFDGAEAADSLCMNPHKWLMVPVDISAFFTRRPDDLRRAFTFVKPYLETEHDDSVTNLGDYGPQLGRRFRGLKLWLVIRAYGVEGIQARLRKSIGLAKDLEQWVGGQPELELMAARHFSLVCFRAKPSDVPDSELNELNRRLMGRINAYGNVFISQTVLRGARTLRTAIGNVWTESAHIEALERDILRALTEVLA